MERNRSYQDLSGKFHEHLCDTTLQLAKFKGEVSDMLIEMNSKIKFIKEFRDQLTQQVDTHRNEMVKIWNES